MGPGAAERHEECRTASGTRVFAMAIVAVAPYMLARNLSLT
jgi:hypothetical protein